ncbi:Protein PafB/PafC [Syntrophomonas zehnderi OL-4]|uniref:Protein PafB/PafC n=1 Tax=Syntrophomonas zehnderi OL-4 TaxID=690567 RepID=A0A0E4G9Z3_9FIRM|nr:Protein PafB/PafC [Syntrophomonas zehnderi OL-4]
MLYLDSGDYEVKIDRLISIIIVLLRRERVQAKELAEMFDVSVRTILRDIDAINLAGIPVVTYQGVHGGISIAEGYRLDKSILSVGDMATIVSTLKGVAASAPDSRYDVLVEKLKIPLSTSQLELLELKSRQMIIDLSPWGINGQIQGRISLLRQAIENRREIEVIYVDAAGTKTMRQLEPYSLLLKGQSWYLYAWCLLRQDFRFFKLVRIKDVQLTDRVYQSREIPAAEQGYFERQWKERNSLVELELLFDKEMESVVEECFGEGAFWQDDGRIMVKAYLPENNWLYGYLLSFGSGMEVINPPHIRKILAAIAEKIHKTYSS